LINFLNQCYKNFAIRTNASRASNIFFRYIRLSGVILFNLAFHPNLFKKIPDIQFPNLLKLPTVSIIVPIFNQEKFLEACIKSLTHQTYNCLEIILVDDGSNAETKEIISKFKNNNLVKVLTHEKNKGLPAALNSGFKAARGELFSWISSDNYVHEDFAKYFVEEFQKSPKAGVLYSDFEMINSLSKEVGREVGWRNYDRISSKPNKLTMHKFKYIIKANPINVVGACFMMRREVFTSVGGYFTPQGAEDQNFWMKAGETFMFKKIEFKETLYFYRIHKDSLTSKSGIRNYWELLRHSANQEYYAKK
jgi:glycosyltransferase involved in cell wall biosynthesis